jgi:hypothetical protein
MTLRQQMTHAEKCARDLIEQFQGSIMSCTSDLRDLSRPTRRRSHYPTMVAVWNSLKKLQQASTEILDDLEYFQEQLQEIHDHARRERASRR